MNWRSHAQRFPSSRSPSNAGLPTRIGPATRLRSRIGPMNRSPGHACTRTTVATVSGSSPKPGTDVSGQTMRVGQSGPGGAFERRARIACAERSRACCMSLTCCSGVQRILLLVRTSVWTATMRTRDASGVVATRYAPHAVAALTSAIATEAGARQEPAAGAALVPMPAITRAMASPRIATMRLIRPTPRRSAD